MTKTIMTQSHFLTLPDDILRSICDLLPIPDLFAFFSACRALRSFIRREHYLLRPPLLLCSNPSGPRRYRCPMPASMNCLKTLTPYPRLLRSMISSRTLNATCIDYSYGHLIFTNRIAIIANPFTGEEIYSPKLPCDICPPYHLATLTSNPSSSSSCILVLAKRCTDGNTTTVLSWKVGSDDDWTVFDLRSNVNSSPSSAFFCVYSMLFFREQLYLLLHDCRVCVLEFGPPVSCRLLVTVMSPEHDMVAGMAECDEQVLLVRCIHPPPYFKSGEIIFEVYRLDLLNHRWVQVQSIGDWCLFFGGIGKCSLSCKNPRRWGGQGNSIYIPQHENRHFPPQHARNWQVFPLDGNVIQSELCISCDWPAPVWVYPSMLLL